ncbi:hypothetical protein QJS04_geneDACA005186 [Acorus gramineus]|uniref:HTH OST-type domain-containing protein n=1 Tax=Acorus gramineus TaxID=55184 RepID=A0AAV9AVC5_ACOGR|nr:hypothetical protein QJS04_geneDACA005186 [Acorus gramineus]
MADVILSSKILSSPKHSNHGGSIAFSTTKPPQPPSQPGKALIGPVAILWDIENCPVPNGVRPEDVASNIRMALRVHPVIKGAVTMFSAYGDFNAFPRRLREGCQRTGVKLVDVPNGRKDAADKAILVDMFLFALDNPPPSSILLISGDVDFAPALHILGQRGYTVILVIPSGVGVSSTLSNAGRFVWDWPSVARGEGFAPLKNLMSGTSDIVGYLMDASDGQNEEESIIYKGISKSEYSAMANYNELYCFNSHARALHSTTEYSSDLITMPCISSSGLCEFPMGITANYLTDDQQTWVQPGDLQGLKGQLVKLLELSGGSLALVRVPAEYNKLFGRPLYVSEYGAYKLVPLLHKFSDVLIVEGQGQRKFVSLRSSFDRTERASTMCHARRDIKKGKRSHSSMNVVADSSDELSDDEKSPCESARLESFKQELQELLVCYSCQLLLNSFEAMYRQRYKKNLDFRSYGVDDLEELIEKVGDVVALCEDQVSKMKFLVSSGN